MGAAKTQANWDCHRQASPDLVPSWSCPGSKEGHPTPRSGAVMISLQV